MPLTRCSKDGSTGWKWGAEGHCYPGSGGRKKAIQQGRAIESSKFAAKAEADEDLMKAIVEDFTVIERMFLLQKE